MITKKDIALYAIAINILLIVGYLLSAPFILTIAATYFYAYGAYFAIFCIYHIIMNIKYDDASKNREEQTRIFEYFTKHDQTTDKYVFGVEAVLVVSLATLFIPAFGVNAISAFVAFYIMNLLTEYWLRRKMKKN